MTTRMNMNHRHRPPCRRHPENGPDHSYLFGWQRAGIHWRSPFLTLHPVNPNMLAARYDPKLIDYVKYRSMIADVAKCFNLEDLVKKYINNPGIREIKQEIW